MKQVVNITYSKCPFCGGKMYLLESSYNAYSVDNATGRYAVNKVKEDNITEFVCSDCGYHVEAEHSIYGILPKKSHILEEHRKELEKGKELAKEIGYVDDK